MPFILAFAAGLSQNGARSRDGVQRFPELIEKRLQMFFFQRSTDHIVPVRLSRIPRFLQLVGGHFELPRAVGESTMFHLVFSHSRITISRFTIVGPFAILSANISMTHPVTTLQWIV